MTHSQPLPSNHQPSPGTPLDALSPRYMAIDSVEGSTAVQRFVVKLQYNVPTTANNVDDDPTTTVQAPPITRPSPHVTIPGRLLSLLKQNHRDDVSFLTKNDELVDLQALTNQSEDTIREWFLYYHRPKAYRHHELWITVETTLTYAALKYPILSWLRERDHWLDLHGFGVQVTRIFRIGYILALEPRHIFRADLQASINREIAHRLSSLTPKARTALYQQYGSADSAPSREPPIVRLQFASSITHQGDTNAAPAETRGLRIECDFNDKNLIEYMMTQISSASPYFGIFLSLSMTRHHSQIATCRTIVQAHNHTLHQHRVHAIAGISATQMDTTTSNGTTLCQQLLALPGVNRLERTPATPSIGKWLVFTTEEHQQACEQSLDNALSAAFTNMQFISQFPRFPTPVRLSNPEPPVDYVNAVLNVANQVLATANSDTASLQAPNAWARGPPRVSSDQASATGSTLTKQDTHTVATQMSEMQTLISEQAKQLKIITEMQKQLQDTQNKTQHSMEQQVATAVTNSLDSLLDQLLPRISARIDEKLAVHFAPSSNTNATHYPPPSHPVPHNLALLPGPMPSPQYMMMHPNGPPMLPPLHPFPMPATHSSPQPASHNVTPATLPHSVSAPSTTTHPNPPPAQPTQPSQGPVRAPSIPPQSQPATPVQPSTSTIHTRPASDGSSERPPPKIPRQDTQLDPSLTPLTTDAHGGIPPPSPSQQ